MRIILSLCRAITFQGPAGILLALLLLVALQKLPEKTFNLKDYSVCFTLLVGGERQVCTVNKFMLFVYSCNTFSK